MKKTILLIGLGAAFLVVSLWVVLSGGRSAKAARAKFRLGGAILTIVGLTSLVSCGGDGLFVTCYDPAIPDTPIKEKILEPQFDTTAGVLEVRNGDELAFLTNLEESRELVFVIERDVERGVEELQVERLVCEAGSEMITFKIDVGDYRGYANLAILYEYKPEIGLRDNYDYYTNIFNIVE